MIEHLKKFIELDKTYSRVREEYSKDIAKINSDINLSQVAIDVKVKELDEALQEKIKGIRLKYATLIDGLKQEQSPTIDLNSVKLQNALKLIELQSKSMTLKEFRSILKALNVQERQLIYNVAQGLEVSNYILNESSNLIVNKENVLADLNLLGTNRYYLNRENNFTTYLENTIKSINGEEPQEYNITPTIF